MQSMCKSIAVLGATLAFLFAGFLGPVAAAGAGHNPMLRPVIEQQWQWNKEKGMYIPGDTFTTQPGSTANPKAPLHDLSPGSPDQESTRLPAPDRPPGDLY